MFFNLNSPFLLVDSMSQQSAKKVEYVLIIVLSINKGKNYLVITLSKLVRQKTYNKVSQGLKILSDQFLLSQLAKNAFGRYVSVDE